MFSQTQCTLRIQLWEFSLCTIYFPQSARLTNHWLYQTIEIFGYNCWFQFHKRPSLFSQIYHRIPLYTIFVGFVRFVTLFHTTSVPLVSNVLYGCSHFHFYIDATGRLYVSIGSDENVEDFFVFFIRWILTFVMW